MRIQLREFSIHRDDHPPMTVIGQVILRGDGKVEFPASFPPGSADVIISAFMQWLAARAVGTGMEEAAKARRDLFIETTGLHGCFTPKSVTTMSQTIRLQRDKINGLRQQMRQMKRGYERKIARFGRSATPPNLETYSYTVTAVDDSPMNITEQVGYDAQRAGAPRWGWPATVITAEEQEDWYRGWDLAKKES